tara:strand:- start:893 stop:1567 length:675 start_codon:yes stop_codon:yes gene_type:complete
MRKGFTFATVAIAASLLAGCGEEDFTGAYRVEAPNGSTLVINIEDDKALLFSEKGNPPRIETHGKGFSVLVVNDKLMLDDLVTNERLVFTRSVDERSLDCVTCEETLFEGSAHWSFDPNGPYDVNQLLADQAKRDAELAAKLSTYAGVREYKLETCVAAGVAPAVCECVPDQMKTMGVSDTDYAKFLSPLFKPANLVDASIQSKIQQIGAGATVHCVQAARRRG